MFKFEELRVYQRAINFIDSTYTLTSAWPIKEQYGLINQMNRAAVSIALNIAEGSSRTKKDFKHFLDMSRGSCMECVAILAIAKNRKYVNIDNHHALYAALESLSKQISALKRSLI
jgi:four helix bundle protein